MKIVTSFSPTRLEAQAKALHSWKKYDIPIITVQCHGETFAEEFDVPIIWVDANTNWSKKTPSIVDVLNATEAPFLLVNSDIEIDLPTIELFTPEEGKLKVGLRTDYCSQFVQLNKYGIDIFCILPTMLPLLTNPIWALGIPGWDYWLVWKLMHNGFKLQFHKDDIMHSAHVEQWNMTDYRRCAKLLEFEFDVLIADISDTIQSLSGRKQLQKKVVKE